MIFRGLLISNGKGNQLGLSSVGWALPTVILSALFLAYKSDITLVYTRFLALINNFLSVMNKIFCTDNVFFGHSRSHYCHVQVKCITILVS